MHSSIRENTHIVLRLPSGQFKTVVIKRDTIISIGKFGAFSANLLLGRPYNLTFEILDGEDGQSQTRLRVVPPAELHIEVLGNSEETLSESRDEETEPTLNGGVQFDVLGENGEFLIRSNRLTIDDTSRQQLSMEEIEELKKATTDGGKEIIKKIMAAHSALNEKTEFSLAKYTLRKSRKYLRRFSVLPMDVGTLTRILTYKDSHKILDLRDENLGLLCSYANVHGAYGEEGQRFLVVDDSGGLVVAALAERMGILYPEEADHADGEEATKPIKTNGNLKPASENDLCLESIAQQESIPIDYSTPSKEADQDFETTESAAPLRSEQMPAAVTGASKPFVKKGGHKHIRAMSASTNTITLLHAASQPNLSLLNYFSYDMNNQSVTHPLYTHLKTLTWLQLLHPEDDAGYTEPEVIPENVLRAAKSGKRANYYRKRRRWERVKAVVDSTRTGEFDGLVIATYLDLVSLLKHAIPLLKGGAQVVIYGPMLEPLLEIVDLFSRERKTAYMELAHQAERRGEQFDPDEVDFPLNPTLLLAPSVQTVRARQWQVLPGRTHPMMTSKGSAEGFILNAIKVVPVEGQVHARGKYVKKRKV